MLKTEEEQFAKTLEQGLKILEQDLAELQGSVIPGNVVFKLYDTYGFPVDLTNDIARERELTIDEDGFEREMEAQRERARASSAFGMDYNSLVKVDGETRFLGYQGVSGAGQIVALFRTARPSSAWRRARRASWSSTRRRSTPSPAARSATVATSRRLACASTCAIPPRLAARTCTMAWSPGAT